MPQWTLQPPPFLIYDLFDRFLMVSAVSTCPLYWKCLLILFLSCLFTSGPLIDSFIISFFPFSPFFLYKIIYLLVGVCCNGWYYFYGVAIIKSNYEKCNYGIDHRLTFLFLSLFGLGLGLINERSITNPLPFGRLCSNMWWLILS